MSSAHRIIKTGTTLVLSPTLSQHFGDSAALVLQQLHYWLSKENISYGVIDDNGRQWIRNSYKQWQKQIQVRSVSSIRLAFAYLEKENIILTKNFDEGKEYAGGSQVKYYTINYDQLEVVIGDLNAARINRPSNLTGRKVKQASRAGETITYKSPATAATSNDQGRTESHSNNNLLQSATLLKISTPPAQNKHPAIYITNTTSENTSLSESSAQTEANQKHSQKTETDTPDKPAEREKNNISKEMISLWNEIVEQNKNEIALNNKRSQHLNAAFKQLFNNDLSQWEAFCCKIASSKFLMGEVKPFKANLDWSIRFEVIQRIIEGGYSFGDRVVNYKPKLKKEDNGAGESTAKHSPECTTELSIQAEHESPETTKIRELILRSVGDANYRSWFVKTEISFEQTEAGKTLIILYTPSTFVRDRLRTHFSDVIEAHFYEIRVSEAPVKLKLKLKEMPLIEEKEITPVVPSLNMDLYYLKTQGVQQEQEEGIVSNEKTAAGNFDEDYIKTNIIDDRAGKVIVSFKRRKTIETGSVFDNEKRLSPCSLNIHLNEKKKKFTNSENSTRSFSSLPPSELQKPANDHIIGSSSRSYTLNKCKETQYYLHKKKYLGISNSTIKKYKNIVPIIVKRKHKSTEPIEKYISISLNNHGVVGIVKNSDYALYKTSLTKGNDSKNSVYSDFLEEHVISPPKRFIVCLQKNNPKPVPFGLLL